MPVALSIQSRSHPYTVERFQDLNSAFSAISNLDHAHFLVDRNVATLYSAELGAFLPEHRTVILEATEEQKSYESIAPIFLELIQKGLKRDGNLIVLGGGVLQDIGCFVATNFARGIHWELLPTTLLAQADSCIGSKSSINIGPYKNQIGSFCPPHRVLMIHSVLSTLPWDQIRSGLGEILKLTLLTSPEAFQELTQDLSTLSGEAWVYEKWIHRALLIKKVYIEEDEFDHGRRNLLNYGHTFGHAFESTTHYRIPHGIGVSLGMLAATFVSAHLGMVPLAHYQIIKEKLTPWCVPFGQALAAVNMESILNAMRHDKKNSAVGVTCILTRGFGAMEKRALDLDRELNPILDLFLSSELATL